MSGSADSTFTAVAGVMKVEMKEAIEEVKIEIKEEFEDVFTAMINSVRTETAGAIPVIVEGEVREVKIEVDEDIEEVKDEIIEEVEDEVEGEFEEVISPTTPQCVLCDKYPKTVIGYTTHLRVYHKSTLISNGIYLICQCGLEVTSERIDSAHRNECHHFTLHKLNEKVHSTPQCVLCESYPSTAYGYVTHLHQHHKYNLKANGIFLLCSCGEEIRSEYRPVSHSNNCDGRLFTLNKLIEKVHSTPQCVLCETHPSTAYGYASHLHNCHKSTLKANEIYLLCSCGYECRSTVDPKHNNDCDGKQFTLHKLEEKSPKCVMCEMYPKTANEYAKHLFKAHRTTLKTSGISFVRVIVRFAVRRAMLHMARSVIAVDSRFTNWTRTISK